MEDFAVYLPFLIDISPYAKPVLPVTRVPIIQAEREKLSNNNI